MSLEVLHCAFMLFSRLPRVEGAEVPPFSRFGISLARVQTVLSGSQFSDHNELLAEEDLAT